VSPAPGAQLSIEFVEPSAAEDRGLVADLAARINRVYAVAEEGLWRGTADRVTESELVEMIRRSEIAVATLDGRVIGSIRVRRLDDATAEFGLLVTDPEHRGIGVGRELVRFAERFAREAGLRAMQLELVAPKTWAHPAKTSLHDWYSRLGYRLVDKTDFADVNPRRAPFLATGCEFRIYQKPLAGDQN
jgi:GNAT superfamily N-acetyltransferase